MKTVGYAALMYICMLLLAAPFFSSTVLGAEDKKTPEDPALPSGNVMPSGNEKADGIRVGSFLVLPEAALSTVYDSNIFATRNNEEEDSIYVFSPTLEVKSAWKRHKLNLDLGGTFGRYATHSAEDYNDYWANISGRYDIRKDTNVFGGMGYSFEHEDRGSLEVDTAGDEPTTLDSLRAHVGVSHTFGKAAIRFGGTVEELNYDNTLPINNEDRNRIMTGSGVRLSYQMHPQYVIYVQGLLDDRDYDSTMDDFGFKRDSNGYLAAVGLSAKITNRFKAEGHVGYLEQAYDDPRFSDVGIIDFGGTLEWLAAPRMKVSLELEQSLEETTLVGASGYLYTSLNGMAKYKLTPRLNLSAGASVAEADYQGVSRGDDYYSAQVGARYYMTPHWYLGAEYRVLHRNSNIKALNPSNNLANPQKLEDYARSQFFLTLGMLLYPVSQSSAYWEMPSDEALSVTEVKWRGLYGGLQAGYDSVNIDTGGGRGSTGIDNSEFTKTAPSAGVFAGYGATWNHWYGGLEFEYEESSADIYHKKAKDTSRTLSVEKNSSYGAAIRAGYLLRTGTLLYTHAGAVRTGFDSYNTVNAKPESADDDDHTLTGVRVGLGVDVPASENSFVRLGYSFTDYKDFDANFLDAVNNPQSESFSPHENLFWLGLGWKWGGFQSEVSKQEVDYSGLYAGAHIGHGALQSETTGMHQDSGAPGELFNFVGDFGGDSGVTGGVFAGYAVNFNRYYIGLEVDVEDSTLKWSHERTPTGRNFSVEKMDTLGLSLRGGYVLENGTLLYIHAGTAWTRFNTTWVKGNNRDNDVDRDDRLTGTRIGVGSELPVSKSAFLRLDYSVTEYDNYDFVTLHGNADTMEFNNSEMLFRLGLGVRL